MQGSNNIKTNHIPTIEDQKHETARLVREINQMLATIIGSIKLAKDEFDDHDSTQSYLNITLKAAERALSLSLEIMELYESAPLSPKDEPE